MLSLQGLGNPFARKSHAEILSALAGTQNTQVLADQYELQLNNFLKEHAHKKYKSELKQVKAMHRALHDTFLKSYRQYASFNDLFENGDYDCLTGTTLFALVFDKLGIDYQIIETNYHVFILLNPNTKNQILIESTDPVNGLITDYTTIQNRLNTYRKLEADEVKKDQYAYRYQEEIFREIDIYELVGLTYFNESVKQFNKGKLIEASVSLVVAGTYYRTNRVSEFAAILILSLANNNNIEENTRLENLKKLSELVGKEFLARN
ncbi:MAG TPA: hypothetical protein PKC24_00355 [Cyclobacteriaceae bacterium]|nr:hypothetical protein [Cyclobacteriaceae bacterium]